jgi:hypothetical protein
LDDAVKTMTVQYQFIIRRARFRFNLQSNGVTAVTKPTVKDVVRVNIVVGCLVRGGYGQED